MSLSPASWTPLLTTRALGRAVNHYEHTLTSTNRVLKDMARQGAPHGSLCLCECQTAGRGRMDRIWSSPEGQGVWLSVLLRPDMSAENAPLITFCCALAMARAVRQVTALDAGLKWPNDLVLHGRKLCGILLEMAFDTQGYAVIAGAGLNVRQGAYPPELAERATSIEEWASVPDRGAIVAAYLAALEDALSAVEQHGFTGIAEDFRRECITLGSQVHVLGADSDFTGIAEDIDEAGALLVRTEGELRRVLAGDVSVRGVMGYV
nr:biotin--[acetyl-CoA-carboxylase] ligase [Clostridia bacterium]